MICLCFGYLRTAPISNRPSDYLFPACTTPVSGIFASNGIPLHRRFPRILSFLLAGNTALSDAAYDRPVYPDIYPVYATIQSLVLSLTAAQSALMRHHSHQVDKQALDGGLSSRCCSDLSGGLSARPVKYHCSDCPSVNSSVQICQVLYRGCLLVIAGYLCPYS